MLCLSNVIIKKSPFPRGCARSSHSLHIPHAFHELLLDEPDLPVLRVAPDIGKIVGAVHIDDIVFEIPRVDPPGVQPGVEHEVVLLRVSGERAPHHQDLLAQAVVRFARIGGRPSLHRPEPPRPLGLALVPPGALLSGLFGIGPELEPAYQLPGLVEPHRVVPVDDEVARCLVGGLDVAMLPLGGVHDGETQAERFFGDVVDVEEGFLAGQPGGAVPLDLVFRGEADVEGEGREILGGLDVVLVGVGPVELHLLAVVGDGEGRGTSLRLAGVVTPVR